MGRRRGWRKPLLAKTGALCREEGERGIRGGFALSDGSGILSRPIDLWTVTMEQLRYSECFSFYNNS
jgi:hypothetical protein